MRYVPRYDGRRRRVNAQHLAACEVARLTGAPYTWLWQDGGISHIVGWRS